MIDFDERMADSRDLVLLHAMIGREFVEAPELIRRVSEGGSRAVLVADHVTDVVELLNAHHQCQDQFVWPLLRERCPADITPLIDEMEFQHEGVDVLLDAVVRGVTDFRHTASGVAGERLARAIETLRTPLEVHFAAEETNIRRHIDRHITRDEWLSARDRIVSQTRGDWMPVLFGMVLRDADDLQRHLLSQTVPAPIFTRMSVEGPAAYERYRARLSGAAA